MKKFIILAAAVAGLSTPAMAQDDAASLGGFKLGVIGGLDNVKVRDGDDSFSKSGFVYGGTIGYDLELKGALIGVEGEYADSTTKREISNGVEFSPNRELYAGVRVGGVIAPNTLLYAKGGYVNAKVSLEADDFSESDKLEGYRLGAGVEHVRNNMFGRLEYRFSDYGAYEVGGFDTGLRGQRHQVVVGAGVRF